VVVRSAIVETRLALAWTVAPIVGAHVRFGHGQSLLYSRAI
jgi:hypothetical protein